jgi:hypothetical protein
VDYAHAGNFGGVSLQQAAAAAGEPGAGQAAAVECRRIDELAWLPDPQVVKIDVEGMELAVLQGGETMLRRARPVIYCENDRVDRSPALVQALWDLGYRLYWHTPPLFNAENHFGYTSNIYGKVCSFNMLCVPTASTLDVQLPAVTDKDAHPLKR